MTAYYNEIEPFAVKWLENLSSLGHIAPGRVDGRSIKEVSPDDLRGVRRAHFFAGIAGWDLALQLAGWPADREVWTGSCPCQSLSQAGSKRGFADERHLWPEWFRLIRECRPPVVFGEQVASPLGRAWLELVSSDLEGAGYAVGAASIPAAGVGAPHARQRLWFVAVGNAGLDGDREHARELRRDEGEHAERTSLGDHASVDPSAFGGMAHHHHHHRREELGAARVHDQGQPGNDAARRGEAHGVADESRDGWRERWLAASRNGTRPLDDSTRRTHVVADADRERLEASGLRGASGRASLEPERHDGSRGMAAPTGGFWGECDWIYCRPEPGRVSGRWRPTEPGAFPLAPGVPGRVGRLRAFGNSISPQAAATFIQAVKQTIGETP